MVHADAGLSKRPSVKRQRELPGSASSVKDISVEDSSGMGSDVFGIVAPQGKPPSTSSSALMQLDGACAGPKPRV